MMFNAECWRRRLAVLVIGASYLTGCAMGDSDHSAHVCPPVVEYASADQARAAAEVDMLPEAAMVVRMLSDYAVLRDQARVCE